VSASKVHRHQSPDSGPAVYHDLSPTLKSMAAAASIIALLGGTAHAQYTAASPTWRAYCEAKKPIAIGMTEEEVLASRWGKPDRVNTTESADHVRQTWVYDYGPICTTRPGGAHHQPEFLYFTDGRLVVVQKSDLDDR